MKKPGKALTVVGIFIGIVVIFLVGWVTSNYSHTYKKIEIPNGSLADSKYKCTRTERYDNPPEFDRALSLINQRGTEYIRKNNITANLTNLTPCVVVKYTDVKNTIGAEGYFIFGDKEANANYLPVYVDNSYKETDDLITALLLKHEITHAYQFIRALNGENDLSCMDKEAEAFLSQSLFISQLNDEELRSLIYRIDNEPNLHPQLQLVSSFNQVSDYATNQCGSDKNCFLDVYIKKIRDMVYANPFYQKQCS
ncbi:hypothetical protein HY384_04230 [Candidatus Daviesbacteria bacterium]|nr:hypothetical protein [Candidatus Daviesbacteria bacterium]